MSSCPAGEKQFLHGGFVEAKHVQWLTCSGTLPLVFFPNPIELINGRTTRQADNIIHRWSRRWKDAHWSPKSTARVRVEIGAWGPAKTRSKLRFHSLHATRPRGDSRRILLYFYHPFIFNLHVSKSHWSPPNSQDPMTLVFSAYELWRSFAGSLRSSLRGSSHPDFFPLCPAKHIPLNFDIKTITRYFKSATDWRIEPWSNHLSILGASWWRDRPANRSVRPLRHKVNLQEFRWPFEKVKATFKSTAKAFKPWMSS